MKNPILKFWNSHIKTTQKPTQKSQTYPINLLWQQIGISIKRREPTRAASTNKAKGITTMSFFSMSCLPWKIGNFNKSDGLEENGDRREKKTEDFGQKLQGWNKCIKMHKVIVSINAFACPSQLHVRWFFGPFFGAWLRWGYQWRVPTVQQDWWNNHSQLLFGCPSPSFELVPTLKSQETDGHRQSLKQELFDTNSSISMVVHYN